MPRADTATEQDLRHGPRKPRPSVQSMYGEYQGGATLDAVGARAGITRERVRQLFNAAGLPTRSRASAGARQRDARALRVDQDRALIVARFRDGADAKTIAAEHNFGIATITRILKTELPAYEYQALAYKTATKRYSDDELLDCLRGAAPATDGTLTMRSYADYAERQRRRKGKPWVSSQTYVARFGTWAGALQAAGLQASTTPARKRKRIDREQCVAAIRTVTETLGRIPTAREYDREARRCGESLPSLATVRKRCGTWYEALGAADA